MKPKEESLQKLTEYEIAAKELMAQDAITFNDVKAKFKGADRTTFTNFLCAMYNQLKGIKQDEFYLKCEDIFSIVIDKNRRWESNYNQITWAISTLMQEMNRMPTVAEISIKAELSRQTIHKHLKEFGNDKRYLETIEQFKFMSSKVLAKVFNFAAQGDIRAAKLYLETVGKFGANTAAIPAPIINTQNNLVQINQLKITQEELRQLKPEQLQKVENLLKEIVCN